MKRESGLSFPLLLALQIRQKRERVGEVERIREGGVGLGAIAWGGGIGEQQWAKAKKIRMAV